MFLSCEFPWLLLWTLFWYDLQILPEKYSYYRRFNQDTSHATDCVICMTAIDLSQRSNDCMVQYWDIQFLTVIFGCCSNLLIRLQVTPCDHFFHSGCLQRWMDVKMECPTCRRPLPPAWSSFYVHIVGSTDMPNSLILVKRWMACETLFVAQICPLAPINFFWIYEGFSWNTNYWFLKCDFIVNLYNQFCK